MGVHMYLGPMFAGKTSKMLEMYDNLGGIILDYHESGLHTGIVMNHDWVASSCIKTCSLCEALPLVKDVTHIFINEGQFFGDLYEFILNIESTKSVYVFALDGDFKRRPMGQIPDALALCDSVQKLKGRCNQCNNDSLFSKRIVDSTVQYLPDASAYVPLCRTCYTQKLSK